MIIIYSPDVMVYGTVLLRPPATPTSVTHTLTLPASSFASWLGIVKLTVAPVMDTMTVQHYNYNIIIMVSMHKYDTFSYLYFVRA